MFAFILILLQTIKPTEIDGTALHHGYIFTLPFSKVGLKISVGFDSINSISLKLYKISKDLKVVSVVKTKFIDLEDQTELLYVKFLTLDHNKKSINNKWDKSNGTSFRAVFTVNSGRFDPKTFVFTEYFGYDDIGFSKISLYKIFESKKRVSEFWRERLNFFDEVLKKYTEEFILDRVDSLCEYVDKLREFKNYSKYSVFIYHLIFIFKELHRLYCPEDDKEDFNSMLCNEKHKELERHNFCTSLRKKCATQYDKLVERWDNDKGLPTPYLRHKMQQYCIENVYMETYEAMVFFCTYLDYDNEIESYLQHEKPVDLPIYKPQNRHDQDKIALRKVVYINEYKGEPPDDSIESIKFVKFQFGNNTLLRDEHWHDVIVPNKGDYKTYCVIDEELKKFTFITAYRPSVIYFSTTENKWKMN